MLNFGFSQFKALALAGLTALVASGCASYSCGAPGGLSCSTLADTYEAREKGQLKHQQPKNAAGGSAGSITYIGKKPSAASAGQEIQDDPQSGRHLKAKENKELKAIEKLNQQLIQSKFEVSNVAPSNPILSRPEVLRVYIARHEADDDFHDEQFVYLRLDAGKWILLDE